jgi:hypothetical protein
VPDGARCHRFTWRPCCGRNSLVATTWPLRSMSRKSWNTDPATDPFGRRTSTATQISCAGRRRATFERGRLSESQGVDAEPLRLKALACRMPAPRVSDRDGFACPAPNRLNDPARCSSTKARWAVLKIITLTLRDDLPSGTAGHITKARLPNAAGRASDACRPFDLSGGRWPPRSAGRSDRFDPAESHWCMSLRRTFLVGIGHYRP